MAKQVYWLSDAGWRRIEPLLPRRRKGAHRVDDRRVISGIRLYAAMRSALARLSGSLWALHHDL
jgi:transposase